MSDFKTFEQFWEFVGSEIEQLPEESIESHVQFVARLAFDYARFKHDQIVWEPEILVYTPTELDIELANEERRKNTGQPLRNNDITSALSICQSVNNQITQMMRV